MEPVGLAVGVVGLVGLFSTCLDTVQRVDTYRDFGNDSRALAAQFKADQLRFEQWGRSVGIENGKLLDDHHAALDDEKMRAIIAGLIAAIAQVCVEGADGTSRPPEHPGTAVTRTNSLFSNQARSGRDGPGESRWRKVSWALRGKERRVSQVEKLGVLVQKLYDLVPVNDESGKPSSLWPGHIDMPESEAWITELRETLNRVDQELNVATRRKLYAWLGDDDLSNLYSDSTDKRVSGTGEWIMNRPEFQNWLAPHLPESDSQADIPQLLWIHGAAGFGKTVMCARVAECLSDTLHTPVAHFFLSSNFASREDPYAAIRSWLKQLISQDRNAFVALDGMRQNSTEKVASRATIVSCFEQVVIKVPECTFVLDGLDECAWLGQDQNIGNNSVFDFLGVITRTIAKTSSRAMIASRDEPEIRNALLGDEVVRCTEYRIKVEDVQSDVTSYAKDIVNQRLPNKTEDIKDSISQKMAERCEGQFLWVKMQAPFLRRGMNKLKLQEAITDTPAGLVNIYERNWHSIQTDPSRSEERVIALLRWAAFALRPLTVAEISEAMLISPDSAGIPADEIPDQIDDDFIQSEIMDQCGPLLEIRKNSEFEDPQSRTVHIPHFSVKEFLITILSENGVTLKINASIQQAYEKHQNTMLAILCIQYISSKEVWQPLQDDDEDSIGAAFRNYATTSWHNHVKLGSEDEEPLRSLINDFFDESNIGWNSWREWFDKDEIENGTQDSEKTEFPTPPIWYAAAVGLKGVIDHLLQQTDVDLDVKGVDGSNTLLRSIRQGEVTIAHRLLNAGAGVDIPNHQDWTSIIFASRDGYNELVKLLLGRGANVDQQNIFGWTCLHEACNYDRKEIVRYLLEAGADTAAVTSNGWTPLHIAANNGFIEAVKLLLEKGADATFTSDGWSPLHESASSGHFEICKLLLEKGADPNSLRHDLEESWTPLREAAYYGKTDIVQLLLENGSDPNLGKGLTPLYFSAQFNYLQQTKILLQSGADPNFRDQEGKTPLHNPALFGYVEMTQLLLARGAEIIQDHGGETPIFGAAVHGHHEIVKILLDKGIDPKVPRKDGWTPLHSGAGGGNLDIIKLFLDKGADPTVTNDDGWSPLHEAAEQGRLEVAKLLIEIGVPIVPSKRGCTPLFSSTYQHHPEIVRLLLDNEADPNIRAYYGETPLYQAAARGDLEITRLLLDHGAEHIPDEFGESPLHQAAIRGSVEIATALLDKGADPNAKKLDDWTPLHFAAHHGHVSVAKLLLDKGAEPSTTDDGQTPMFLAAGIGDLAMVKFLLDWGHDCTVARDNGWTPLHEAAYHGTHKGYCEIVRLLLEKGAPIVPANDGTTPLHWAADLGRLEIAKILLERKADPNLAAEGGWTPLRHAIGGAHMKMVPLLIRNGADIKFSSEDGTTYLHTACENDNPRVVRFLLETPGIDANACDDAGRTPLFSASRCGRTEVIRILDSDPRININLKDRYGLIPLYIAIRNGHPEIVEILLPKTRNWLEWKDRQGRSLVWWAVQIDCSRILQLLVDAGAKADPTQVWNDDSVAYEESLAWCDVCGGCFEDGTPYYECEKCQDGTFAMCTECFETEAKCFDSSHALVSRKD